jgi:hypothetical protein
MSLRKIHELLNAVSVRLRLHATYRRGIEAEPDTLARGDEERLRPEELQEFVDRLYGGKKPTGVVDDFIIERRQAARE